MRGRSGLFLALGTALAAGGAASAQTVLNPAADAHVRAGSYNATNYGNSTTLEVKRDTTGPTSSYTRDSLLRFDTSSVAGTVSNAKLRVYGKLSGAGTLPMAVYSVSSTTWVEGNGGTDNNPANEVKWTNKPAYGTTALASTTLTSTTLAWFELDITAYVAAEPAAGRNVVSLVLTGTAVSSPVATFNSKEATTNKPQLSLTVSGGSLVDITVDNPAATLSAASDWLVQTSGTGYTGANWLRNAGGGAANKTATFAPTLPEAGKYVVYIKHMGGNPNATYKASATVNHLSGPTTIPMNELLQASQWVCLGAYDFAAGTAGNVVFATNSVNQYNPNSVDAVRFYKPAAVVQDPAIDAGLTAWRTPDALGQRCADCHGMHGFDLAIFDFDGDGDIVRRALNHVSQTDAQKVRDMLLGLRSKYNLTLLDHDAQRPFQPGSGGQPDAVNAQPTAGATAQVRDHAFVNLLKTRLPTYTTVYVDTLAEATMMKNEIMAASPWDIRLPVPMNRYSQDRFNGEAEALCAEWVPMLGRAPKAGQDAYWFGLHDAYNMDPQNATLWEIVRAMDTVTEIPPTSLEDPSQATGTAAAFCRDQLKSLLLLQHMDLKRVTGQLTTFFDKNKSSQTQWASQWGNPNMGILPGDFIWDAADAARVGQAAVGNQDLSGLYDLAKIWRWPQREVTAKLTPTIVANKHLQKFRVPWFYMGWMVEQGLRRTGDSNSTQSMEYWSNAHQNGGDDVGYATVMWYVAARHSFVYRFDIDSQRPGDPLIWVASHEAQMSNNPSVQATQSAAWFEDAAHYADYNLMVGNYFRAKLLLVEAELDSGTYPGSVAGTRSTLTIGQASLLKVDPSHQAANDDLVNRVTAKLNIFSPP